MIANTSSLFNTTQAVSDSAGVSGITVEAQRERPDTELFRIDQLNDGNGKKILSFRQILYLIRAYYVLNLGGSGEGIDQPTDGNSKEILSFEQNLCYIIAYRVLI